MSQTEPNNGGMSLTTDPFVVVLNFVSFFHKNRKFNLSEIDIHKYLLKCKEANPDIFEDFFFDDDPDLPYSEEVADALVRLQDAEVFSRPNPAMKEYYIKSDLSRTNQKIEQKYKGFFKKIAEEFEEKFGME